VDRALLERMTDALVFRGPDGRGIWTEGIVGLGHTLFSTTEEPQPRQPVSLDGAIWVTADLRIDGRLELIEELRRHHRDDLSLASDVELLLHAYRAWGEDCPEHLLGDYAFVIWDGFAKKLFAARDPFGVKLLYYAEVAGVVVLGNTLNAVRLHPGISDRMDGNVIADFLIFGRGLDPAAVAFADVKALPAGRTLVWNGGRLQLRRFWSPPEEEVVRYSDSREYLDEFSYLLDAAVSDRLRTGQVGVWMSGGLDSTLIAAVARDQLLKRARPFDLQAVTLVHHTFADRERHYSEVAAAALGIPQRQVVLDDYYTHWHWMQAVSAPEPTSQYVRGRNAPLHAQLASIGRVALTGWDGDALLASSIPDHWRGRLARMEVVQLQREVAWFIRNRTFPRGGWRRAMRRLRPRDDEGLTPPSWLNADFVRRTGFTERYRAFATTTPRSTSRGLAYHWLDYASWRQLIDDQDPGVTGALVESRHPLTDLRIVRFALRLPVVPWCFQKHLLREAAKRLLPAEVAERRKRTLGSEPLWVGGIIGNIHLLRDGPISPELREYVDVERLVDACASIGPGVGFERPELYSASAVQAVNTWFLGRARTHRTQSRTDESNP
jgi:asparagine synthase (glutamine-hydrolysing)